MAEVATEKLVWRVEIREVELPWVLPSIESRTAIVYGEGGSPDEALSDLDTKLHQSESLAQSRLRMMKREYG